VSVEQWLVWWVPLQSDDTGPLRGHIWLFDMTRGEARRDMIFRLA